MAKVFIDGREGTTGLRICERLAGRSDIELLLIDPALYKDIHARKALLNEADACILCLPDAAAAESAAMVENPDTVLIDASTAHRTLPGWAYGFPELSPAFRKKIASGKRIAVPGCHASGFAALIYPLVANGALPADAPLFCHSITGYSGGGKKMIAEYEDENRPAALSSPRQYALTQNHKHLREMKFISALAYEPVFTPIVADFYAGMVVTVPLHAGMLSKGHTLAALHELFCSHYQNERWVRVRPELNGEDTLPGNAFAGRDDMEIALFGNDERILLTARFDNLGKGASGAAVQVLNIALGLDEGLGLQGG